MRKNDPEDEEMTLQKSDKSAIQVNKTGLRRLLKGCMTNSDTIRIMRLLEWLQKHENEAVPLSRKLRRLSYYWHRYYFYLLKKYDPAEAYVRVVQLKRTIARVWQSSFTFKVGGNASWTIKRLRGTPLAAQILEHVMQTGRNNDEEQMLKVHRRFYEKNLAPRGLIYEFKAAGNVFGFVAMSSGDWLETAAKRCLPSRSIDTALVRIIEGLKNGKINAHAEYFFIGERLYPYERRLLQSFTYAIKNGTTPEIGLLVTREK